MATETEAGDIGGAAALIGGGGDTGGAGGGASADAAAGGGADAGGGGADQGGVPDFFEKVSATPGEGETASNRDWLASKGFKDLDAVVKSARYAEKAIHDKGRIAVPGEGAKPEEVAAFRTAIGVPDKVDGYEVKAPDGIKLNDPLIATLRESALKHGTPKGAFEGLVNDFIQSQLDQAAEETKRQDGLAAAKLKEWGGKANEQIAHVNAAASALSLSKTDMDGLRSGLGADRALDLLAKLGAGMAEDTLITGGKGRFGVTGAEAQAELDRMKTDPDIAKKVMVAGSPERQRWDRLTAAAADAKAREQG